MKKPLAILLVAIFYTNIVYGNEEDIIEYSIETFIESGELTTPKYEETSEPKPESSPCNGDPNAIWKDCGNDNCGRLCSNYNKSIACLAVCKAGCNCKPKYVYDKNTQRCVLPKQCTPICKKDEVYNSCTNSGCVPQNCTQLGFPVPCVRLDPKYCIKGCVCAGDKLRTKNGTCVDRKQCDSFCGGDKNSVPGCGTNCNQRCSQRINEAAIACTLPCNINGCDCKKGYLYDDATGKCELPNKCSVTCGKNEKYSPCVIPNCNFESCRDRGKQFFCSVQKTSDCVGKCICEEGYLRDENGVCIPENTCPSLCNDDDNAIWNECGNNNCGRLCSNYNKTIVCPAVCQSGCNCKSKYVLDENIQKCVLPSQCTPVCKKDEVYNSCTNSGCVPQNCTQLGFPVPCKRIDPKFCIKGCVCAGDRLRTKRGDCVPRDQCDSFCGGDKNSKPGCGTNCGQRCSQRNNTTEIACTLLCNINGCDCKKGYFYDDPTGKCVLPNNCSVTCGENETYSSCVFPNCFHENCTDKGKVYSCPVEKTSDCIGKCICKKGFLRDGNGKCIPENTCPSVSCGKNEIYSSCPYCHLDSCKDKGKVIFCPAYIPPDCVGKCICQKGYLRDSTGNCIPESSCPPQPCKPNELYNSCINNGCVAVNCTQLGFPLSCARMAPGSCRGGCMCQEDYLRAKNGSCVPKTQCDSPCGGDKNAISGCGGNCGRYCSDLNNEYPVACKRICDSNGCDCKDGYWFDDITGKCMLPEQCPIPCGLNEIPSDCVNARCGPEYCSDLEKPNYDCSSPIQCYSGCQCKPGYLRNRNGICIEENTCPQSCNGDYNALPGCGINCGRHCYDIGQERRGGTFCNDICSLDGCDCKEGYYLDDEKQKCVLPEECTPRSCNGDVNAVRGCGINCGRQCSDYNRTGLISCPAICYDDGCDCKDGYVFDSISNKCVLPEQCSPDITCDITKNEVYSDCVNDGCSTRDCTELGTCRACNPTEASQCEKGCVCRDGYLRARNGVCVPETKCNGPCNGDENAWPGCGVHCGTSCGTYKIASLILCIQACYEDGCDCKPGYVFDENISKCVIPEQCSPVCKPNEIYNSCINNNCKPRSCDDLGNGVTCQLFDEGSQCIGGCECAEGYLYNREGDCVPRENCDSCGGDINAQPGCGGKCGRLCSNYNSTNPIVCPLICRDINGCDCRPGYWFDEFIGKCVLPEECPPPCGKNEVLSTCVEGECKPEYCFNKDDNVSCDSAVVERCTSGCVCKVGYYRNRAGFCVPENECPTSCNGDPNALPGCGVNCGKTCSREEQCIKICYEDGCDCKEGYFYDRVLNKCVEPEQCTSCKGDPNAYPGCGVNCGKKCSGSLICPRICYPDGCDCKIGYLYDDVLQKCVKKKQCSLIQPTCGVNEELSNCSNAICRAQNCTQRRQPIACPVLAEGACKKGCVCQPNYLRGKNGLCVPEDSCDVCPVGENYSTCPTAPCDAEYCPTSRNSPSSCVSSGKCGKPRCVCGFNSRRDRNTDICIPISECPPFTCDGPNESYVSCPAYCPGEQCSDYLNNSTCPTIGRIGIVVPCRPQCRCNKGYFRNKAGVCVLGKKCDANTTPPPPVCGINEESSPCIQGLCRPQSCSQKGEPIACPDVIVGSCTKGCVCKENYLRALNGTCVPEDECDVCPDGEYFSTCPPEPCDAEYCPQSRNAPLTCVSNKKCSKPRCICGFNSHRDRISEKCIPTAQCPPFPCKGPHEIFVACPPVCPGQNCSDYINNSTCPKFGRIGIVVPCKPQCRCKSGYYRGINGDCILANKCDKDCKINEVYSECVNGGCDARNCTQLNKLVPCVKLDPAYCNKGCVCKSGYLRNSNGLCVPKDQCDNPIVCGKNEVETGCINSGCSRRNCSQLNGPILCVDPIPGGCIKGCVCQPNYLRDKEGKCIPENRCPENKCKKDYEYYERCINLNDPQTCESIGKPKSTSSLEANTACIAGCRCKPGYYKNKNEDCIPQNQCPQKCGEDEVFSECVNGGCDKRNCTQYNSPQICVDPIQSACIRGCVCKTGLLRSRDGKCIPQDECPESTCLRPNEFYDYCPPLNDPQTCETINKTQLETSYNSSKCVGKCRCKSGFHRNKIGECISQENCFKCTGPYEYYSCGVACDNVCATLKEQSQKNCSIINIQCNKMCYCEADYARDENNICIPIKKCPKNKCTKRHEVYDKCIYPNDPRTCESLKYPASSNISEETIACTAGCRCKEGYYRNEKGDCVRQNECPQKCGEDEEFSECVNGGCEKRNCTQYNSPQICVDPIECACIRGCVCKTGLLRNRDGKCIPQDKCPENNCRKKNEFYDYCAPENDPQTCESISKLQFESSKNVLACVGKCRCKPGFYRDKKGECISRDNCLRCTGPNEYYACGGACDNVCATLKTQSQKKCPIINVKCNDKCYCEENYARDENNICIPIKDCAVCPKGEVYSTCPPAACDADFCPECQDAPQACVSTKECKPARCVCAYNYRRDRKTLKCVPVSECPPFDCDEQNEVYDSCPLPCPGDSCAKKNTTCPLYKNNRCNPTCRCADNYCRNSEGFCVPEKVD